MDRGRAQTWQVLTGDVREQLATLPAEFVQCCVTSPPYFSLRDYGVAGQIGLEATPEAYVAALVEVFGEVCRVLREDGTLWLNLGDSYAQNEIRHRQGLGSKAPRYVDSVRGSWAERTEQVGRRPQHGLKTKNLLGIPWRVAFALQADGWYLRSDIIWSKPNPMPESVQDRPTKAHEYVFLLTKAAKYYYNAAAIREPYSASTLRQFDDGYDGNGRKDYAAAGVQNPSDVKRRIVDKQRGHGRRHAGFNDRWDAMPKNEQQVQGANKRSVWTIATQPFPGAHFATFPEELPETCILAGSKPGDLILDPFAGSGTVGAVALRLGRSFVGIDLNPEYVQLARQRIGSVMPLLATEHTA